jgi:UDP-glucose 4-epimerase
MVKVKEDVLVTGAAGFIGAHLTRRLINDEYNVVALDDLSGGFKDYIPNEAIFVEGSITDHQLISELFDKYNFKYVYHLAAYAAEGLSHFIRRFNYTNNLIGSVNLINESVKNEIETFVFTSSIAVYGDGQVPMKEEMVPEPEDPYGIAKYAVELDLKNAHEMFGLNYVIFRPHNVYGEFQNIGDKYRNVVGIFMNQILQDKPLTIFGDGEQKRAFSYIGDIIEPIATSPTKEEAQNEVFNIGADSPYTVNTLSEKICEVLGAPDHEIRHLEARNEVKIAYSDHSKAYNIFGKPNHTSLEEGLTKMYKWVEKVGARSTPKFDNIEVKKNLPLSWGN